MAEQEEEIVRKRRPKIRAQRNLCMGLCIGDLCIGQCVICLPHRSQEAVLEFGELSL